MAAVVTKRAKVASRWVRGRGRHDMQVCSSSAMKRSSDRVNRKH